MEKLVSGIRNYFTSSKTSKRFIRKNKKKKSLMLELALLEVNRQFLLTFSYSTIYLKASIYLLQIFIYNSKNSLLLMYRIGASQQWLLYKSSYHLFLKYRNYKYSESYGEHKIILGLELIKNIKADNNIQVFNMADFF